MSWASWWSHACRRPTAAATAAPVDYGGSRRPIALEAPRCRRLRTALNCGNRGLKIGQADAQAPSTVWGEGHVEVDLDLVPELEGAKECRVGPDSPSALDDGRPSNDPAVGHTALHRDRPGDAHDRKLAVEGERHRRPVDPPGPEGDGWMLGGVEDLLEGLADLCAVGVGERFDAAGSLLDLEGVDVNLDGHRGVRRVGGVDRGVTMPAGDLDGEIVAGLGAQPCTTGVDQQPAGLRSEPVGTGDAHGLRLRRCQIPAAATGGGHDHGGDREGTCGDPFGLCGTTSRRPRPATTRRSPENRPHAAPRGRQILVWAPGEDGPNLRRDNPQEPCPGGRRANPPAPGRLGPWGSSVPRGTLAAFPSLARGESRPTTRRSLEPHRRTAGCATHRPAVRRPGPSALLAGTPTRISRSNRVGPSGQLFTLGAHEVAVKATFPLAGRIRPAHDGLNYFDGIWGDEPSLGPSAPGSSLGSRGRCGAARSTPRRRSAASALGRRQSWTPVGGLGYVSRRRPNQRDRDKAWDRVRRSHCFKSRNAAVNSRRSLRCWRGLPPTLLSLPRSGWPPLA